MMGKITDSLHLQQSLSFAKSPGFSDKFNNLVKSYHSQQKSAVGLTGFTPIFHHKLGWLHETPTVPIGY